MKLFFWSVMNLFIGVAYISPTCSNADVSSMLLRKDGNPAPPMTANQRSQWNEDRKQLTALWSQRNSRDISQAVMRYVDHPSPTLRDKAIRILGRIQATSAEAKLEQVVSGAQIRRGVAVSRPASSPQALTARLALARIRSRRLRGEARVRLFQQLVGLTSEDFVVLSHRLNDDVRRPLEDTDGNEVFDELVDLIYQMRKQGDNAPIALSGLKLSGAEMVMLRGAQLPPQTELTSELDYLAGRHILTIEDLRLVDHLIELHPSAHQIIADKVKSIAANPAPFRNSGGFIAVFAAAVKTGNRRAIPYLQDLERDSDRWIRQYAKLGRKCIELGKGGVELP